MYIITCKQIQSNVWREIEKRRGLSSTSDDTVKSILLAVERSPHSQVA